MSLRFPSHTWAKFLCILGWAGDNATVNNTQNTTLGTHLNNLFQPENHSFLLRIQPFEKKGTTTTDDPSNGDADMSSELSLEVDDDDSSLSNLVDATDSKSLANDSEGEDACNEMDEVEKANIIEQMKQAKVVNSRVCKFLFALVHSTMRALPAWCDITKAWPSLEAKDSQNDLVWKGGTLVATSMG
ncbi:hypothetical protein B0H14DRAFT_2581348 [Mycena olivaceomarginata]|nr:hypothetical protein B0H14DRAFT_2581348 [Mycena olivaceomarginata]